MTASTVVLSESESGAGKTGINQLSNSINYFVGSFKVTVPTMGSQAMDCGYKGLEKSFRSFGESG